MSKPLNWGSTSLNSNTIYANGEKGIYTISKQIDAWRVRLFPNTLFGGTKHWFRDTLESAKASAEQEDKV